MIDFDYSFPWRWRPGPKKQNAFHSNNYKTASNHKSRYLIKSKHPVFSYIDGFPDKASSSTYIPSSTKYQPSLSHSYNQKKYSRYFPTHSSRWENSQKKSFIVDKTFNIDRATILSWPPTEVTNPLNIPNTSLPVVIGGQKAGIKNLGLSLALLNQTQGCDWLRPDILPCLVCPPLTVTKRMENFIIDLSIMGRIQPVIELENPIIFPEISVIRMKTSTNKVPGAREAKTDTWSAWPPPRLLGIQGAIRRWEIICKKTPCHSTWVILSRALQF